MNYVQSVKFWLWKNNDAAVIFINLSQLIGILFLCDSSAQIEITSWSFSGLIFRFHFALCSSRSIFQVTHILSNYSSSTVFWFSSSILVLFFRIPLCARLSLCALFSCLSFHFIFFSKFCQIFYSVFGLAISCLHLFLLVFYCFL